LSHHFKECDGGLGQSHQISHGGGRGPIITYYLNGPRKGKCPGPRREKGQTRDFKRGLMKRQKGSYAT